MRLLINVCAHDGIISHYTGVGTMVKRYIKLLNEEFNKRAIEFNINLFSPQYNIDSFGFSKETKDKNLSYKNVSLFQISNGTNGKINFGTPKDWEELSKNTAKVINNLNILKYDKIITIYNDTPFAGLGKMLNSAAYHYKIWIPHSSIKIHKVDLAIENSADYYDVRLEWEQDAVDYINSHDLNYIGVIGLSFKKHLIEEYRLKEEKAVSVINGVELKKNRKNRLFKNENKRNLELFKAEKTILLAYGRAEEYKGLDYAMKLGVEMRVKSVVIAQSYHDKQPILKQYQDCAKKYNSLLFINPPFNFPEYILNHFKGKIVLLVPSQREIMGLIINEVRLLNKSNILIVANDIESFSEQITDAEDGIIVDLNDIGQSAKKVEKFLNYKDIKKMNKNSQERLKRDYDMRKNLSEFLNFILEERDE